MPASRVEKSSRKRQTTSTNGRSNLPTTVYTNESVATVGEDSDSHATLQRERALCFGGGFCVVQTLSISRLATSSGCSSSSVEPSACSCATPRDLEWLRLGNNAWRAASPSRVPTSKTVEGDCACGSQRLAVACSKPFPHAKNQSAPVWKPCSQSELFCGGMCSYLR